MKKLVAYIPVLLIFAMLAGLFVFMCLPHSRSNVTAAGGIIDLRGETAAAPLSGEWEFAFGELLTPHNFKATRYINVPGSWTDESYPLNGFATYRLTILTDAAKPLTLFVPEIYTAYSLWVDGELVRTAGAVSDKSSEGRALIENALLIIIPKDGKVELVIQISNYHFVSAGLLENILFGESGRIQSWFFRTRAFYCIALGCILMAAFYHLTLYIYRRREKTYLFFSVLCFLCFFRFIMETNGLNQYLGWLPKNIIGIKIYLASFYAHSFAIFTFSLYIFNRGFLAKYRAKIILTLAALFLAGIFFPANTSVYLLIMAAAFVPLMLFVIIMASRSPVLKENGTLRLYFTALIFFFIIGAVSKMLYLDHVFFMLGLLSNTFLILSQSIVLSRRYTDAFRFVEETNQNLEGIVAERTKSLQATNDAMKELIANISHDLKTPLSVLSVNLEKLGQMSENLDDAEYQRHVNIAYRKNIDMQRLLQNLFEVSRIESGRGLYEPKWIPLNNLLANIQRKYGEYLDDKGITLHVSGSDDAEISADPQKIWSVFDNIIYNAVRYTPTGRSIAVSAESHDNHIVISVTDTGCGIASEHLPRIFERFYKGSSARGGAEGDSGLGLYIVKSITEGCGGSVGVQSEEGKGTTIYLKFISQTP